MSAEIETILHDDIAILTVSTKRFIGGTYDQALYEKVNELIESGIRKIIIDLKEVFWANSTGVGILFASLTATKKNGGHLILTGMHDKVEDIFQITHLIEVVDVKPSVQEAIEAMKNK